MNGKIKNWIQAFALFTVSIFLLACSFTDKAKALKAAQNAIKSRTKADIVDATIHNNHDLRFKITNTPLLKLEEEDRKDSAKALAIYAKRILNENSENMTDAFNKIIILIYKGGTVGIGGMDVRVGEGSKYEFFLKDL